MLDGMIRKSPCYLQQPGAATAIVVCAGRRCSGPALEVDRVKMSGEEYHFVPTGCVALLVSNDIATAAAIDHNGLPSSGVVQCLQLVLRPGCGVGIVGAGGVAGREGSQVRKICLEGSARYFANEMLDCINPCSPGQGKGVDLENNLVLWEG